jgi:hypothetical protein
VELYRDTNSEGTGNISNAIFPFCKQRFIFLKAWETVTQFLRNNNQLTVVLDNLKPASKYSVRAVIIENDGQKTFHNLKGTLFTTLPCVPRGMLA